MGYLPNKDTKFSGTETLTNLTANAGGTIDLDAASAVTVPNVAIGAGLNAATIGAVNTALGAYLTTAAAAAAYQPLDSDLTTIAGLTATTDNFLQAKAGAWASRTVSQVVTDLVAGGLLLAATAASTYATIASPTLTGTPAAPTAVAGTNTTQIATTAFVTAAVATASAGLDAKESVRVATTAAGTLATSFENGDTVDGVVLATGNRILIKDQAAGAENGIYVVNASGAPTRATDADSSAEVTSGLYVWVEEGTTNADTGWVLTTNSAITLGTTALTFTQFSGLGQIVAGAGLTKSGNTLTVGAGTGITVNADDVAVNTAVIAPLASPPLTGTPTAPTAAAATNTTQIATTAFVKSQRMSDLTLPNAAVPMNSQKLTGLAAGSANGDSLRYEQLFTSGTLTLNGPLALSPASTISGATTVTATTAFTLNQGTGVFNIRHSGDANDRVRLSTSGLEFGAGAGLSLDWALARTAANEATVASGDNLKHDTEAAGANTTVVATTEFVQRDSRRKVVGTIADGSFPLTISVSGGLPSYDVVVAQQTAAGRVVNLPAASAVAQGTTIVVKDGSASGAGTYNLTVNRAGADLVEGLTSFVLDSNGMAAHFMSDGVSNWWLI